MKLEKNIPAWDKDGVWDKVEERLIQKKKRRVFYWWFFGAASIIIGATLIYCFNSLVEPSLSLENLVSSSVEEIQTDTKIHQTKFIERPEKNLKQKTDFKIPDEKQTRIAKIESNKNNGNNDPKKYNAISLENNGKKLTIQSLSLIHISEPTRPY